MKTPKSKKPPLDAWTKQTMIRCPLPGCLCKPKATCRCSMCRLRFMEDR